jgi:predicted alpha/beta superfamily hydrolase
MHKPAFLISFLLFVSSAIAQLNVRLEIKSYSNYPTKDTTMYAAGSFNGWNPQDEPNRFQRDDKGNYFLNLKLNTGSYEYKITRGSWDKVECKKDGMGISNRSLKVDGDVTVELNIEEWQDRFAAKPRVSSRGDHVHIIDTAFLIPQLNRVRRIWIYLPENYYTGPQEYRWPVLYMHDGQNVFDDATSYAGEWGVDEFLDSAMVRSCIVVAIDNGASKRINEYCPYDFSLKTLGLSNADTLNKGEGDQYVDFLVKTLKPFIDKNYRTLKDKKNTFIAGSSMGGIISMYAVLKYPKIFGGAGVFSPAFWVGPKIFDDIKAKGEKVKSRIYFYAGKQESESMVSLTLKAFNEMSKVSKTKMTTVIRDEGKHNEVRWRIEFPLFYFWMIYPNGPKEIFRSH